MRLREIRIEKGLSQSELARRSRVHRVSICRYEAGVKKPSVDTVVRLADALGVTTDELLRDSA